MKYIHCKRECKLIRSLWKTVPQELLQLNLGLPYDSTIRFIGIYPTEMHAYAHKYYTLEYSQHYYLWVPNWKPLTISISSKIWINILLYICTSNHYIKIRMNNLQLQNYYETTTIKLKESKQTQHECIHYYSIDTKHKRGKTNL